jgi:hypothetical protein
MRVLPESKILYFEATADEAARSMAQIESYSEFEPSFQRQVMEMVRRMYEEYGIVLWITYTGWRRGFGDQLGFGRRNTMAGPGRAPITMAGRVIWVFADSGGWTRQGRSGGMGIGSSG